MYIIVILNKLNSKIKHITLDKGLVLKEKFEIIYKHLRDSATINSHALNVWALTFELREKKGLGEMGV